ncbi:hypothetical protein BC938DRAFT_479584 [Jimgerdemannia flammicorona]|uniref:Uncharacterized protein n=1 Tax=Jimgerdemannia flammicorona TaxID=994334 RepID=A0A433QKJ4_9FUNG|nr:hypothetical protein BC938DRAFT_479584 [Jimgerdemannia flammicorona]
MPARNGRVRPCRVPLSNPSPEHIGCLAAVRFSDFRRPVPQRSFQPMVLPRSMVVYPKIGAKKSSSNLMLNPVCGGRFDPG